MRREMRNSECGIQNSRHTFLIPNSEFFVLTLALAVPGVARAQTTDPRFYVSVNAGVQRSGNNVTQSFSVQKNLEDMPITADIDEKRGVMFDGGVVVRLAGRFGMGIAASVVTNDTDANVTASVPHPFFFAKPRSVAGTTPWFSAPMVLRSPASPDTGSRWPMFDFADPIAQNCVSEVSASNACFRPVISTGSPSSVPVPCAST